MRRPRSSSTSSSSTTGSRRITVSSAEGVTSPANELLLERLMGVIRAEPARVTDWAAKSVGAAWRAFDLQLLVYAGLLVATGLVMAYTNSVENGSTPLEAGTTFTRGLMWAGIAAVTFILATAFDYRWLRTLSWPVYALQLGLLLADARDRRRHRRLRALDHRRSAHVPVQRARQDPHDHRARELAGRAEAAGSIRSPRSSAPASSSRRRWPW